MITSVRFNYSDGALVSAPMIVDGRESDMLASSAVTLRGRMLYAGIPVQHYVEAVSAECIGTMPRFHNVLLMDPMGMSDQKLISDAKLPAGIGGIIVVESVVCSVSLTATFTHVATAGSAIKVHSYMLMSLTTMDL